MGFIQTLNSEPNNNGSQVTAIAFDDLARDAWFMGALYPKDNIPHTTASQSSGMEAPEPIA